MTETRTIVFLLIVLFLQSCSNKNSGTASQALKTDSLPELNVMEKYLADSASVAQAESLAAEAESLAIALAAVDPDREAPQEETEPARETRLRYRNFSVVFHEFKGYEKSVDDNESYDYYLQFSESDYQDEAGLNEEEQQHDLDYKETLIVNKDTLHLSEFLFDNRINNTLIQIIPNNKDDRFKISMCYLSYLNEVIDRNKYSRKTLDSLYEKALRINEKTPYYPIKDSAYFYFRALPHTPDMVEVTVVNDKVVPVKESNTKQQIDWEQKQYEVEIARIKKKYHFKDTLVYFSSEGGGVTAILTKENKLFSYGYHSFLFRIERYRNNKRIETKYIVIGIAYGC